MASGFIIAPLSEVKKEFPEFRQAMGDLEDALIARAKEIWPGFKEGGLLPKDKEFGIASIRPRHTKPGVAHLLGSNSFLKSFTAPGSSVDIFSYTVPDDLIHAWGGIGIPDSHLIFNDFQFVTTDITLPRIPVEEARLFPGTGFAIVLKPEKDEEIIVAEKSAFVLRGYQERATSGLTQRVMPIGLAAYRKRDLYITLGAN